MNLASKIIFWTSLIILSFLPYGIVIVVLLLLVYYGGPYLESIIEGAYRKNTVYYEELDVTFNFTNPEDEPINNPQDMKKFSDDTLEDMK